MHQIRNGVKVGTAALAWCKILPLHLDGGNDYYDCV